MNCLFPDGPVCLRDTCFECPVPDRYGVNLLTILQQACRLALMAEKYQEYEGGTFSLADSMKGER